MNNLSNRPPRPRKRTARPAYPRALTIHAVALAAACAGTTLGCNLIGTSSGDMVGPYEQGGAGGAHEGGGGELGGGGSSGGAGGSEVGGGGAGGSEVGGGGAGGEVGGAGGGQG